MSANRSNLSRVALAALCVASLSVSVAARGDDQAPAPKKGKSGRSPAVRGLEKPTDSEMPADSEMPPKGLTPDQQQLALEFAKAQHPELAELLEKLKESKPKEFGRALQDLYRAQQRLSRMSEKTPERFALEISLWKVQSRIRLLAAQMVMEGDTAQDETLKALLSDRRDLKIQLLRLDRARADERLASLDQQLAELQRDPRGDNENELAKLKQTAGKQGKAAKKSRSKAPPEGTAPGEPQPKKKPKTLKDGME
jgi:hypothetical protein